MSLDGLRAWIGEVERKLGMRTRVFLALSAIAIGGAGAAIYLAVDAHNKTVSESDLQALQRQLEGQAASGGGAAGSTDLTQLETEVKELKQQVEGLTGEEGSAGEKESGADESGAPGSGGPGNGSAGTGDKEASTAPPDETIPTPTTSSGDAKAKLKELIEHAQGK